MNINIYADEMLFINFVVNMAVILISKKLLNKKIKFFKEILISFCFSLLSFMIVITSVRQYINFFSVTVIDMIMALLLFSPPNINALIKYTAVIRVSSLFINESYLLIKHYFSNIYSIYFLLLGMVLAYFSVLFLKYITNKYNCYHNVNIVCNEKTASTVGFVDTGNSLIEPISGKPVIIAEFNAIKKLLPDDMAYIYDNNKESSMSEIVEAISDDSFKKIIRIIPFKSIGNENGMLIGFVADKADIDGNCIKKPVVAIYRCSLSGKGGYNTLLSPRHLGGV